MTGSNGKSNVVMLCDQLKHRAASHDDEADDADMGEFIADMLAMLMTMVNDREQPILIYLLAMARIEALAMMDEDGEN
jgi:hypothetical protein